MTQARAGCWVLLFLLAMAGGAQTVEEFNEQGQSALLSKNLSSAHEAYEKALNAGPGDPEASLLLALTTIGTFFEQPGESNGPFQIMLNSFGVTYTQNLYAASISGDFLTVDNQIPANAQAPNQAVDTAVTEIDAVLAEVQVLLGNVGNASEDWRYELEPGLLPRDLLPWTVYLSGEDAHFFSAGIDVFRSVLKIASAYDLSFDYDAFNAADMVNQALWDSQASFLTLRPGHEATLSNAKSMLQDAATSIEVGLDTIAARPEARGFVRTSLTPDITLTVREYVDTLQASLSGPTPFEAVSFENSQKERSFVSPVRLDLSKIFANPLRRADIELTWHPSSGELWSLDTENVDYTVRGAVPDGSRETFQLLSAAGDVDPDANNYGIYPDIYGGALRWYPGDCHLPVGITEFRIYRAATPDVRGTETLVTRGPPENFLDSQQYCESYFLDISQLPADSCYLRIDAHFGENHYISSAVIPRDTDGDSLPDCWELQHWQDLTVASSWGYGDSDGDGISNHAEYVYQTNPTEPDALVERLANPTFDLGAGSWNLTENYPVIAEGENVADGKHLQLTDGSTGTRIPQASQRIRVPVGDDIYGEFTFWSEGGDGWLSASVNGTELWRSSYYGLWQDYGTIDLRPYAGQEVILRFEAWAGEGSGADLRVDDVHICVVNPAGGVEDIDGDGQFGVNDQAILLQGFGGVKENPEKKIDYWQHPGADLNGDDLIDVRDLVRLLQGQ